MSNQDLLVAINSMYKDQIKNGVTFELLPGKTFNIQSSELMVLAYNQALEDIKKVISEYDTSNTN